MAVTARELQAEVANLHAQKLAEQSKRIYARQQERMRKVGEHVKAMTDLYPGVVLDEQALASLRAQITEVLGKPHSLARPFVEPLASTPALFLDQAVFDLNHRRCPGLFLGLGPHPRGERELDQPLPDLRETGAPLTIVDGVKPYVARILHIQ